MCATRKTDFIVCIFLKTAVGHFCQGKLQRLLWAKCQVRSANIFFLILVWIKFRIFLYILMKFCVNPKNNQYRNMRFCIVMRIVAFLYHDNRCIGELLHPYRAFRVQTFLVTSHAVCHMSIALHTCSLNLNIIPFCF